MTVRVHDARVYSRMLREGSVGLGESYADGWWDTDDLTGFLRLAHRSLARTHAAATACTAGYDPSSTRSPDAGAPDKDRDARNIRAHYDLGNEFFQRARRDDDVLVRRLRTADGFAGRGVRAKLDRLADLLALAPGDRVLEIGTGWGGFAIHAAKHYGCHVTTTTISPRQYEFAAGVSRRRPRGPRHRTRGRLPRPRRDLRQDRRDRDDRSGRLARVRHVLRQCRRLLDDDGALAMQAIVVPDESFDRIKRHTDFIKAAIFPGGCLPSVGALTAAANSNGFSPRMKTTSACTTPRRCADGGANLTDARDELDALGLDERFARLWEFYFSYCEAGFDERYIRDVQLLYTAPAWRPPALRTAPSAEMFIAVGVPELVQT